MTLQVKNIKFGYLSKLNFDTFEIYSYRYFNDKNKVPLNFNSFYYF